MRMQFLLVMLLLLPTRAHAETRDFSVTDVTQIVGEWEGSYFVKPSGTTGTSNPDTVDPRGRTGSEQHGARTRLPKDRHPSLHFVHRTWLGCRRHDYASPCDHGS